MISSRLAVLVLTWNDYNNTIACLRSLIKIKDESFEVILIDNHSTDDSLKRIRNEMGDTILYLQNKENLGYGKGFNKGIELALDKGFDFLFLLNNDTFINDELILKKLICYCQSHHEVGVVGPRILSATEKKIQRITYRYPALLNQFIHLFWIERIIINWLPKICFQVNWESMKEKPSEVDWISGAAMFFRSSVFKDIGKFDPNFFIGAEDIDICYRAREKGYKIIFYPHASIIHIEGQSGVWKNPIKTYLGLLIFFAKYNSLIKIFFYKLILCLFFTLRGLKRFFLSLFSAGEKRSLLRKQAITFLKGCLIIIKFKYGKESN